MIRCSETRFQADLPAAGEAAPRRMILFAPRHPSNIAGLVAAIMVDAADGGPGRPMTDGGNNAAKLSDQAEQTMIPRPP